MLIVDEVISDTVNQSGKNAAIAVAPTKIKIEVFHVLALIPHFLFHRGVEGDHHPHIVAFLHQRLRECARYVAQASDFDEGERLACGK